MIDSYNVFDRASGSKPFLLADGYGSRLRLPFVNYVKKSSAPWSVCLGVPYATHIWQVQDSNRLNGAFKSTMKDKKSEMLENRGEYKFKTSDVVPLVKQCFNQTFGNRKNAKKAIVERGWGPLNSTCLDHVELNETTNDTTTNKTTTNNIITPLRPELQFDNDPVDRPLYEKYVDILYREAARSKARKKKWEERKKQMDNNEKGNTHIKNLRKLTSGQMAANSHYDVTDDEVYKYLKRQEKEIEKEKKKMGEKQAATAATEKKRKKAWRYAYQKWESEDKQLYGKDYKVLLKSILMDGDVLPKKVADLKRLFEREAYQDLIALTACEEEESDDESTTTCDSDITIGTRTDDIESSLINGEKSLTELEVVKVIPTDLQPRLDENVPGEEQERDSESVATAVTAVLAHDIRSYHKSHAEKSTTTVESHPDVPDEDDCISVSTADTAILVHDIKYRRSVNILSHTVASTTDIDQSHDTSTCTSVTVREQLETSESSLVIVLAGMRHDLRVEGVFDKTVVREEIPRSTRIIFWHVLWKLRTFSMIFKNQ